MGIIGIIASTAIGCYLCYKKKSDHHPYKKAPAHSVDMTECDIEDSVNGGGRASIVMPTPAGYGKVTMLELDGEDEDEEDDLVEQKDQDRNTEMREQDADCVALNV